VIRGGSVRRWLLLCLEHDLEVGSPEWSMRSVAQRVVQRATPLSPVTRWNRPSSRALQVRLRDRPDQLSHPAAGVLAQTSIPYVVAASFCDRGCLLTARDLAPMRHTSAEQPYAQPAGQAAGKLTRKAARDNGCRSTAPSKFYWPAESLSPETTPAKQSSNTTITAGSCGPRFRAQFKIWAQKLDLLCHGPEQES